MKKSQNSFLNVQMLSALLFLALAAVGIKIVVPKASDTLVIYNQLGSLKSSLDNLKSKVADLGSLNEFELADRNSSVTKALPADRSVINRMAMISAIADQNGLLIENMKLSSGSLTASGSSTLSQISIDLTVTGGSDQITSFLVSLKNALPLVNIKSATVNLVEGNATLKMETYYLGFPVTIGKIDSPVPKLSDKEEKILTSLRNYSFPQPMDLIGGDGGKVNPFVSD